MIYSPIKYNNIDIETLPTASGNFSLENGIPYYGIVYIYNDIYISGIVNDKIEYILVPANEIGDYKNYNKINNGIKYEDTHSPINKQPIPKESDYKKGFYNRFFIKKRNDQNADIYEVDEQQYKDTLNIGEGVNGALYYGIKIQWKLVGLKENVYINQLDGTKIVAQKSLGNINEETIIKNEVNMIGLRKKIRNYTEFARLNKVK